MKQEDRKAIEEHRMICAKYRTAITEDDAERYSCIKRDCKKLFVLSMIPKLYVAVPV